MLTLIQRSVCYSVFFACFISWTSICSDAERLFHRRDHSDLQSENQQRAEPITDPHTAEMFLSRYGFLRPVNWEELLMDDQEETDLSFLDLHEFSIEEGASLPPSRNTDQNRRHDQKPHDPHFTSALRDFQKRSGLPVTGVLDEATKDAMNRPRCGVPDVEAEPGDKSSGDQPWQTEITDDESLQEKPNSESVGFQHLDDVEMLDKNLKRSDSNSSEGDLNNGNLGSDLKTMKNISTTLENAPSYNDSYNGSRAFEDDLPSTDHETNQKFTRMDKKATEPEGFPLNQSNESNTFTNGDSNMTFANYSVPMSNQTFIDKSDTETGNLNHSEGYLLNNNSTDFSNETNVFFMDNLDPNLINTASIEGSGNPAVANLTFENETAFDDNHNRFGDLNDFSFNQRVNDLKDYDTENSTFSDDFTNETKSNSDPVSKDVAVEKMLQSAYEIAVDNVRFKNFTNETNLNSLTNNDTTLETKNQSIAKKCVQTKENSTVDSVNVWNFINETNLNSSTIFDPIDNNTRLETKRRTIVKSFTKTKGNFEKFSNETNLNSPTIIEKTDNATFAETKLQTVSKNSPKTNENSTFDNANFENFANGTNLNSLTIFDKTNNATSSETELQTIDNSSTKTEKNSTIHFDKFINETNLNSSTIFDPIDNNTILETKRRTTVKNFTKAKGNFEKFSNETNLNSPTIIEKTNNATFAETKLQTVSKNSPKTNENSTFDNTNFENFANGTNLYSPTIFDSIDRNTTVENIHQNVNQTAIKNKNMSTFDNVNFENFTNETNLNSLTFFDKTDNATSSETELQTIDKDSTKTLNSSTIFDSIDSNTTVENIHQNVNKTAIKLYTNFTNETNLNFPTIFAKTDNATSAETKLQTIAKNSTKHKENSTIDDANFENFTNETNLNSSTISDPMNNATSTETKHQTIAKKPIGTTELAQNSDAARRKRHLAALVSRSHARKRRDVGGHVAFSKSVLRWRLIGEGYSSQLAVEEQRYVFRLAFRMWSEVCPLEFTEDNASPLEEVDIRLGFGTGRHLGCKQRFDGSGREFAHAWFLGDIHFDDDEHFTGSGAGRGISLLKVAVHEIGHVLGLPHIYRPGSIMQPSYRPHESGFEVDWMDRKAIQSLYGGCKGRFDAVFDWVRRERSPRGDVLIRFNTYFLRRGWYWLYENRNNRTRFGDPVSLQSGWRGLPLDGVDAFVHVWSRRRDHAYFFKGAQFWRYDGEQDQVLRRDPDGRSYPRPISEGFPGVPAPIDTAVYDRRDGNIYFFKGRLVYAFSVDSNRLARGFPRPLRSVFPALDPRDHPESGLDAAYFSYTHNALFLLKDTRFWRVAGARERRAGPRLRKNSLLPHRQIDQQWFDICNVHPTALRLNP